ncbi:hypothetical protein AYI69_g2682 [Smittium culicis]|uniref:Uncharacterized protein n=1 Tax=Smittium culicis TaxID=133412 RepID=A0A1R1YLT2_9FUNG|nr:hypothetical protein AYI69_g2682 [Smittium culicis]
MMGQLMQERVFRVNRHSSRNLRLPAARAWIYTERPASHVLRLAASRPTCTSARSRPARQTRLFFDVLKFKYFSPLAASPLSLCASPESACLIDGGLDVGGRDGAVGGCGLCCGRFCFSGSIAADGTDAFALSFSVPPTLLAVKCFRNPKSNPIFFQIQNHVVIFYRIETSFACILNRKKKSILVVILNSLFCSNKM